MNVLDNLKDKSWIEIQQYCADNSINASVAMMHITGDFNLSTVVRNANFFGFKKVYYVGSKRWDRRGSVGTHHYTPMLNIPNEESFISEMKEKKFTLIGVENNIPQYDYKTYNLFDCELEYDYPVFIFGEEKLGLSDYILDNCHSIITIPNYGSVRSLNVGTTSGIVMSYYRQQTNKRLNLTNQLADIQ